VLLVLSGEEPGGLDRDTLDDGQPEPFEDLEVPAGHRDVATFPVDRLGVVLGGEDERAADAETPDRFSPRGEV
jgi:hypothetical protein